MITLKAPWNERDGRFSPLKAIVFAALFAPALWILYQYASGALFPKPVTEMIHRSGDWALRLILLSLLVTPLRKIAQWPKLIAIRRMVGVAAFAYAFAHLCLYVVDQKFDLLHVASEIALRFYLTIGFVALLGLGALAATSTDKMIKRLGAIRWNQLHKLIYAIGVLAVFHFYLQSKADVSEPVMMTGFFLMLMLYRSLVKRAPLWLAVTGAVVIGAPLTALLEATWYAIRRGYNFWEVLGANIDPDMFPRPTAYVAVAGVAALIVLAARELQSRRASRVLAAAE
jgi:sulfoxide reductase heme-binding subunit YedZ